MLRLRHVAGRLFELLVTGATIGARGGESGGGSFLIRRPGCVNELPGVDAEGIRQRIPIGALGEILFELHTGKLQTLAERGERRPVGVVVGGRGDLLERRVGQLRLRPHDGLEGFGGGNLRVANEVGGSAADKSPNAQDGDKNGRELYRSVFHRIGLMRKRRWFMADRFNR